MPPQFLIMDPKNARRIGLGGCLMVAGLTLSVYEFVTLPIDLSVWRTMVLNEKYWLELLPLTYFLFLTAAGASLIWPHRFSLLLVFTYVGFTLEELVLGFFSPTAVSFRLAGQIVLWSSVLIAGFGLHLLRQERKERGRKYRFRALWYGIGFGLATNLLLAIFGI